MSIKPKSTALLLCVLLAVSGCSTGRQATEGTSFLWEVTPKSDTSKTIYLLGSIHLAPPELYPLNPAITAAWQRSTALAVEINLKNDSQQKDVFSNLALVSRLVSFSQPGLSSKLPAPLYQRVQKRLAALGGGGIVDTTMINYLTPLGAAIMLELGGLMPNSNLSETAGPTGIDMHFIDLAEEEDKPIYELESFEGQMDVLEAMADNIVPYIESVLKRLDEAEGSSAEKDLFEAWATGDVGFMAEQVSAPMASDPATDNALKDAVLYKRNVAMASKIENYLAQDGIYFVVVGAGHYVGPRSIIELLEQSGKYNIRRL